jgi:hypothetical protein
MSKINQRIIATDGKTNLWLVRDEVFRADVGAELDTWKLPMGRRWVCTHVTYLAYRSRVFASFVDVYPDDQSMLHATQPSHQKRPELVHQRPP